VYKRLCGLVDETITGGLPLQEALVELLQGSLQRVLVALVQLFLTTCAIDLQARSALKLLGSPVYSVWWS
jgi:hypothetical protein